MKNIYKIDMKEPKPQDPCIAVVEALPEHVRILGGNLRERDNDIANKAGLSAHRELWRIYKKSIMCKAVLVGGEIVAIWGVHGVFLGKVGKPWFVASPFVEDYPMKLAFRYRSELRNMLKYFTILEDWVSVDDDKTIRLLEILGFKLNNPEPIGKAMFIKATLERPWTP